MSIVTELQVWVDVRSSNLYHYAPCCFKNGSPSIPYSEIFSSDNCSNVICSHCSAYSQEQTVLYQKSRDYRDLLVGLDCFQIHTSLSDGLLHFQNCCAFLKTRFPCTTKKISQKLSHSRCVVHLKSMLQEEGGVNISNDGDPYDFGSKFTYLGEDQLIHFEDNLLCPWNGIQGELWGWEKWDQGKYDGHYIC